MNMEEKVVAVEAEVVSEVKKVEEVVVSEVDKVKQAILAQKVNFQAQLEKVKQDMTRLQQEFEKAKQLGIKLEGALESIELLLKGLVSK